MFRKATMVGALALMFGALLVPAAQAQPRQLIPYLSHGIGVDKSLYSGTTVIPYLSHGIGVDKSLYGGSEQGSFPRPDDRAGTLGVGASSVGSASFPRPDDRAGIRGVGQNATAATSYPRPDDRAGIRGVGNDVTAAEPASTSSFDWTRFLVGAAVALALMLAIATGVVSSKRHSKTLQTG